MKSILTLRQDAVKSMQIGCREVLKEVTQLEIKPLSASNIAMFASDMTVKKCDGVTEAVDKGEKIIASIEAAAISWRVSDDKMLVPDIDKLRDVVKASFKAVVSAFAAKCIVSKSAQKGLVAAINQAERALNFAQTNNVELDEFIVEKPTTIQKSCTGK